MLAWIFDECREGKCPVGAKIPLIVAGFLIQGAETEPSYTLVTLLR